MRTEDYNELQELLEIWFGELDAGRQPDPATICADRPDLLSHFERIVKRDTGIASTLADAGKTARLVESDAEFPTIEGYEIITRLGSGGRGEVYLARQASLDRLVALKVLHSGLSADPTATANARKRLIREAELTALLDHPNIVPIYDVGEAVKVVKPAPTAYIAMKWLSGPGLDQVEEPLDGREIARIGIAVAGALHEAHLAGIVHRDIKPANIVLDRGEPRVVDFGLARESSAVTNTVEGQVSGTLPYMSPEQLRAGTERLPLDGRADIYSLGATLYELAVGRPPFLDDNPGALIHQILLHDVPRPRGCDKDLATVLLRALEKDRERRFASAQEFAEELARYRDGEPIRSRPIGPLQRVVKRVRRYPRASAAVGVSMMSALLLGGVLGWQELDKRVVEQHKIAQAGELIAQERFSLANEVLDQMSAEGIDVEPLQVRLGAEVALEDILDRLQSRHGSLNEGLIQALSSKIRGHLLSPERREIWFLAMAASQMLGGKQGAVRDHLAGLSPSRARAAIMACATGTSWPWQLPEARSGFVWDRLFTIIAMRAARIDGVAIDQEIEIAERANLADYRVRRHILEWAAEDRRNLPRVLTGLKCMSENGLYPRAVVRGILHAACSLGDEEEVRIWLEYFLKEGRYPRNQWSEIDAAIVGYSLQLLRDDDGLDQLLSEGLGLWPESASLWLLEAAERRRRPEKQSVVDALERALACADRPAVRNRARVNLVRVRCQKMWRSSAPSQDEFTAIQKECQALLGEVKDRELKSEVCVLLADLALYLGSHDIAGGWLEKAIEDDAHATPLAYLSGGLLTKARYRARLAPGQPEIDSEEWDELKKVLEEGRAQLRTFLSRTARSGIALKSARLEAYLCLASLGGYLGDRTACMESVRDAEKLAGSELRDDQRALLRYLTEKYGR